MDDDAPELRLALTLASTHWFDVAQAATRPQEAAKR
jgi:hypothetical protein